MSSVFRKSNKDGQPKTCKFCRQHVWWHVVERRWYDVGGETLHVDNCERRKKHYHNEAMNAAESQRQQLGKF